jgi:hypothetical protein
MDTKTITTPDATDGLFSLILDALQATGQAQYEAGKYVKGADNQEAYAETAREASVKTQAMWAALYEVAPAIQRHLDYLAATSPALDLEA